MSDSLHIDLEPEMQNKTLNLLPTELTELPHIIPDDAEPTMLNPNYEILNGTIDQAIPLLSDPKLWQEMVCFPRNLLTVYTNVCSMPIWKID